MLRPCCWAEGMAKSVAGAGQSGRALGDAMRRWTQTGRPWEKEYGYSRAIRVGNLIETSLTSPAAETGEILFPGDVYRQTHVCLDIIKSAIVELGGKIEDVYRTRFYLLDPSKWVEAGRAHKEFFGDTRPTCGWIYMAGVFSPGIAVEVECSALCEPRRPRRSAARSSRQGEKRR